MKTFRAPRGELNFRGFSFFESIYLVSGIIYVTPGIISVSPGILPEVQSPELYSDRVLRLSWTRPRLFENSFV